MWFEEMPKDNSWSSLWSGFIICGYCRAIRRFDGPCSVCGDPPLSLQPRVVRDVQGREIVVPTAFIGAEGRYEDWVYLRMIEREWKRPVVDTDYLPGFANGTGPSSRAAIVLLFWSYFETRIERLLREGLRDLPERLSISILRRYSHISTRMDELYKDVFGSTYREDLREVGYGEVWSHLSKIQDRRNRFAHGQPQAIDDELVQAVVAMLRVEHEAWIAVFNKRAARRP